MNTITKMIRSVWLFVSFMPIAAAQATCDNDKVSETTPDSTFEIHDDGTVTHLRTGLMWSRCLHGQATTWCAGVPTALPWHLALQAADAADLAGYDDWRLPNRAELASLVEYCRGAPALNTSIFPNVPWDPAAVFWTSTPFAELPVRAWAVLNSGAVTPVDPTLGGYVRLVRTPERLYQIGDVGPAGGIIVYDKGTRSDGWRYLEAASKAWSGSHDPWTTWGCEGTTVGTTATAIGTGAANTAALVTAGCSAAAQIAAEAEINGYEDWFLPSREELKAMHDALAIGTNFHDEHGLATMSYASSSELNSNSAIAIDFAGGGSQVNVHKTLATVVVRPVRAF